MQRIALSKSQPGMVLAQAVRMPDGPVLVGEGLTLTENVIERIRRTGVSTIWVEGNPLGPSGNVDNLRELVEKIPHLFRRHQGNIFMTTLCTVFVRHFARKLSERQAMEDNVIEQNKNGSGGTPSPTGYGL